MGLFDSGILSPVSNALFGEPSVKSSGAFPGLKPLGSEYNKYLLDRLSTPVLEQEQFRLGSQAIRDSLSQSGATARKRLGDTAAAGGFLDSGVVFQGLGEIERASAQAYAQEITQLLLGLEAQRSEGVLPYLSGGASEYSSVQQFNASQQSMQNQLMFGLLTKNLEGSLAGEIPGLGG